MRLTSLAALGVGYVLGSRAGKERYEQIREAAQQAAKQLESYGEGGSLAHRLAGAGADARAQARRRGPAD
ncbi:hypothetical protein [Nocardioides taihuensis]|uniref:YtxH domain-containing protein n=1 Tax=Nocardioides taihuensis TaxID=1835606 RepID=A0ABW0BJ96_9ACTN